MHILRLLGTARVDGPAGRVAGKSVQRHRLALLSLLATARDNTMPRERLMAFLWPEQDTPRARHLLNVAVHAIRSELGDDTLHSEGSEIRLDPGSLDCDISRFRAARERGDLDAAIAEYGGPFLDGFYLEGAEAFERWQEVERARLAAEMESVLERRAAEAESRGEWALAAECWRRLVLAKPENGLPVLRLMLALEAAGDRAGALHAADAHTEFVAHEYGATPDAEVTALARRLRSFTPASGVRAISEDRQPISAGANARGDADAGPSAPARAPDAAHGPASPAPLGTAARNGKRWSRGIPVLAALALLVAAVSYLTAHARWQATDPASVAVLPFMDLSEDQNQAYFSDGLTEELLNSLARIEGLRVAARSSSFRFREPGVDIRTVGRELDVAAVVEGSVRRDGDQLRVTAQLIDTHTGFHLWSQQFDRAVEDVFAVQEAIAREVASALSAELVRGIPDTLVARATAVPEAYDSYLRGRHGWNLRTREGMLRAVDAFQHAVDLDPTYAAAYAGLADAWQLLPDYADVPAREGLARAKTAALRAIALDSTLAAAHAALGALRDDYDRDRAGAERSYRRAIELNPGYSTARQWLAIHLADEGRFDEALEEIERSRRLDPGSLIISTAVGAVRYFADDLAGSIAEYEAVLDREPEFAIALALLGRSLLIAGRAEEAVDALKRSVDLSGGDPSYRAVYAAALAAAGRREEAIRIARDVEVGSREGYVPFCELGGAWVFIGDSAKALELFERGLEARDPAVKHMKVEPLYDAIRAHPRFQAVLARAGLISDKPLAPRR